MTAHIFLVYGSPLMNHTPHRTAVSDFRHCTTKCVSSTSLSQMGPRLDTQKGDTEIHSTFLDIDRYSVTTAGFDDPSSYHAAMQHELRRSIASFLSVILIETKETTLRFRLHILLNTAEV